MTQWIRRFDRSKSKDGSPSLRRYFDNIAQSGQWWYLVRTLSRDAEKAQGEGNGPDTTESPRGEGNGPDTRLRWIDACAESGAAGHSFSQLRRAAPRLPPPMCRAHSPRTSLPPRDATPVAPPAGPSHHSGPSDAFVARPDGPPSPDRSAHRDCFSFWVDVLPKHRKATALLGDVPRAPFWEDIARPTCGC